MTRLEWLRELHAMTEERIGLLNVMLGTSNAHIVNVLLDLEKETLKRIEREVEIEGIKEADETYSQDSARYDI